MSTPFNPDDPKQPDNDAYRYPFGEEPVADTGAGAGPADPGYGAPGYGSAGYGAGPGGSTWAMHEEKNRVAPWCLGVGILALVGGISIFFTALAFLVGIVGVILGIVALVRGRKIEGPGRRTGMSVVGIVLSVVSIGLSVLFWVLMGIFASETGIADCMSLTDPAEQQACVEDSVNEWADN